MNPTAIDSVDVFDNEGTLALQINGWDVLYLTRVRSKHPEHPSLTREQHQKIIDAIIAALIA